MEGPLKGLMIIWPPLSFSDLVGVRLKVTIPLTKTASIHRNIYVKTFVNSSKTDIFVSNICRFSELEKRKIITDVIQLSSIRLCVYR